MFDAQIGEPDGKHGMLTRQGDVDTDCAAGAEGEGSLQAELESVVSAAVLVATAFRLRDERGLVAALRCLTSAVDELERTRPAD